jgi:hypothetical protein
MAKSLRIEQLLHGYSHGHHLLAGSIELSKSAQQLTSVLSDLSGPEVSDRFAEYITGYPLADDKYYALGKTWYASEMNRPGCAWTHTLLIRFEDIKAIGDGRILFPHFRRPCKDFERSDYCSTIELQQSSKSGVCLSCTDTANELRYLLWSIYEESKPIILPSDSPDEYEKLILLIWQNQWGGLRKNFSFCTGSFAGRKLGRKSFDIQVVPHALAKSVARGSEESSVADTSAMKASLSGFPNWVGKAADEMLWGNESFRRYLDFFGGDCEKKQYFSSLARLYLHLENGAFSSVDEYLAAATSIFNVDEFALIMRNVLESASKQLPNRWFKCDNIVTFLSELACSEKHSYVWWSSCQLMSVVESLWHSDRIQGKTLFKRLISRDLNQFGESLLKEYSQLLEPEQLPALTDMDLGACNVIVRLNPRFALSSAIWRECGNFQREIIHCLKEGHVENGLPQEIVRKVLIESSETLCDEVFDTFGEVSIRVFLEWAREAIYQNEKKVRMWAKICAHSPETCIQWLSLSEPVETDLLILIVSALDPYSDAVCRCGVGRWAKFFGQLRWETVGADAKLVLAQFFLPLVLASNEVVAEDVMKSAFQTIHDELRKNRFDYGQWLRLERLLPSASWYNSWDKCKRLRRAMRQKGYKMTAEYGDN